MPSQTSQLEEQIIVVLQLINQSRIIPDDHKPKYVEYIQKNGLSEKMVEELTKVFEKDAALLDGEIVEDKEALSALEEMITKEQAEIDEPQARLLAALDEFNERNQKELEATYEGMQKDVEKSEEEGAKEGEKTQEEAIRAKLAKPKKTA